MTQQELASSKQFVQHMSGGKTLLEAFPLEKFFKTHPHEHGQKADTQTSFSVYAQWVKDQNSDVGGALESICTDWGKPELSIKTQEVILSWLSTTQQTLFKQQ